jgi:hypothetical protein
MTKKPDWLAEPFPASAATTRPRPQLPWRDKADHSKWRDHDAYTIKEAAILFANIEPYEPPIPRDHTRYPEFRWLRRLKAAVHAGVLSVMQPHKKFFGLSLLARPALIDWCIWHAGERPDCFRDARPARPSREIVWRWIGHWHVRGMPMDVIRNRGASVLDMDTEAFRAELKAWKEGNPLR